jgi:hypothetical protein
MSTGGPDPTGPVPPDHDTARGDFGNSSVSRMGMPSMLTGLIVVAIAIAVILAMIL